MIKRHLTWGELKDKFKNVPDNTPVIVPVEDHSFRRAEAVHDTALFDVDENTWTEDHGDFYLEYCKQTEVIIIS